MGLDRTATKNKRLGVNFHPTLIIDKCDKMRLFNISEMIESGKSGTYYQLCNQTDYVSQPTASEE